MQTQKIFATVITLFAVGVLSAQQAYQITTTNDLRPPPKGSSFQVNIIRDSLPTGFSLMIQNPQKKKLQVQLSHSVFGVAADTTINTEQFARRYNLDEADDGIYIITVRNGKEKFKKQIEMNTVMKRNLVIH